jgi:hypothetical protein
MALQRRLLGAALTVGFVVLAIVLSATARAITLIASLAAETPVRAWAGIAVLSVQEPGGSYRLATQQGTEAPRLLPDVKAARYPFDANIGPGPSGSPVIVFARCASAPTNRYSGEPLPKRCSLRRTTLGGTLETSVSTAGGVGGDDHAPAIWGNRLAFARPAKHGSDWVYIVPLEAGSRARAVRVRSAPPPPKCDEATFGPCTPLASLHPTVTEMSLHGSILAENLVLGSLSAGECAHTEVRLIYLAQSRGEQVKSPFCGIEGGQALLGVSLTATHLLYTMECGGDENICEHTKTLVYRYGLRNHRTEAAPEHDLLTGFAALDDSHAVEVSAPEVGFEEDCARHEPRSKKHPLCQLVRVGPIRFKRFHF